MQVNVTLTVPAEGLSLPLASDPNLSVAVNPPLSHWGPGPVNVRLISHTLRQGQVGVCVFYEKEIMNYIQDKQLSLVSEGCFQVE